MIESYEIFRNDKIPSDVMTSDSWSPSSKQHNDEITVAAVLRLGRSLDGHEGIVHGGIMALLIDNVLGFGY
jgi:hypothetical protein